MHRLPRSLPLGAARRDGLQYSPNQSPFFDHISAFATAASVKPEPSLEEEVDLSAGGGPDGRQHRGGMAASARPDQALHAGVPRQRLRRSRGVQADRRAGPRCDRRPGRTGPAGDPRSGQATAGRRRDGGVLHAGEPRLQRFVAALHGLQSAPAGGGRFDRLRLARCERVGWCQETGVLPQASAYLPHTGEIVHRQHSAFRRTVQ